jgi:ABC-type nitrate/sulfonate/bicarbonate transport system permease component
MDATSRQPYRTKIFLGVILVLYLWDIAFFLGLRDPDQISHPFAMLRSYGDIVFLRGFGSMLREMIFAFVSGGLAGIGIGAISLHAPTLTGWAIHFLRIIQWVPFIVAYAVFAPLFWGIMTAMLCAAYHYLAARSILKMKPGEAWSWTAREALLQTLLFSLISQIWVDNWRWFIFSTMQKPTTGLATFMALAAMIALINWCFRSNFVLKANNHALLQTNDINGQWGHAIHKSDDLGLNAEAYWIFLTVGLAIAWLIFAVPVPRVSSSAEGDVLITVVNLLTAGEIWADMGLSLLEVIGGITLAGSFSLALLQLSRKTNLEKLLFRLLPLTHISAMIFWLFVLIYPRVPGVLYFWHKVIAIGCLTLFPSFQSLWGTHTCPLIYRVLAMTIYVLPVSFAAMVFSEAMAATQGLGFSMIVANATLESNKALAVCLVTFLLLVGLLSCLKFAARKLFVGSMR